MGGENRRLAPASSFTAGSSPRGRGKPRETWDETPTTGLIPAWAGKTSKKTQPSSTFSAHPRVGGENMGVVAEGASAAGSSPRGRGKPRNLTRLSWTLGLIPAWAGKTRRGQTV